MILYVRYLSYEIYYLSISLSDSIAIVRPSFWRYLMAVNYDLLLLLAWLFIATLPIIALNDGEAIGDSNPFFIAYLWLASFVFYGWFWTHGGQTLGMRAWRIRLVSRR